jgi:hypothetical protein
MNFDHHLQPAVGGDDQFRVHHQPDGFNAQQPPAGDENLFQVRHQPNDTYFGGPFQVQHQPDGFNAQQPPIGGGQAPAQPGGQDLLPPAAHIQPFRGEADLADHENNLKRADGRAISFVRQHLILKAFQSGPYAQLILIPRQRLWNLTVKIRSSC